MVVEVVGLRKAFGRQVALDGVDLHVAEGEVLGFLGPNGAGKSTTIRILLGLLRRSGGEARLWSHDVWDDAVMLHRRIAYVPGDVNLWPNLSGGEAIDVLIGSDGRDRDRRDELIERFELDPTKQCRTYSKGNRQKVALIAALSRRAELLVLDEPTSGLDPLMEAVFDDYIAQAAADGSSVLLSSHLLAQVQKLCHRVTLIRAGRIAQTGTLAQLRHLTRTRVRSVIRGAIDLQGVDGVHGLRVDGRHVEFSVETERLDGVIGRLHAAGIDALTCEPPSLEELFLEHYRLRGVRR